MALVVALAISIGILAFGILALFIVLFNIPKLL